MGDLTNIITIRSNDLKPSKGRILISEPLLNDKFFHRSVVLLVEHNNEGTFGFIINKPARVTVDYFLPELPADAPVYLGGPVSTENLYYIHTSGDLVEESIEVMDGLYWGGNMEQIQELLLIGKMTPADIKFFIGYSGWMARQLDGEIEKNSWLVSTIKASQVMKTAPQSLWESSLKRVGKEYAYWTKFPEDPQLN